MDTFYTNQIRLVNAENANLNREIGVWMSNPFIHCGMAKKSCVQMEYERVALNTSTFGNSYPIEASRAQAIDMTEIVIHNLDIVIAELQAHQARLLGELEMLNGLPETDDPNAALATWIYLMVKKKAIEKQFPLKPDFKVAWDKANDVFLAGGEHSLWVSPNGYDWNIGAWGDHIKEEDAAPFCTGTIDASLNHLVGILEADYHADMRCEAEDNFLDAEFEDRISGYLD